MGDNLRATKDELRRLVAAGWWKWMPGMLVLDGEDRYRVLSATRDQGSGKWLLWLEVAGGYYEADGHDLRVSDHATAGCLQELYFDRYAAEHEGATRRQALQSLAGIYNIDEYASLGDVLVKALLEVGVCWTYRPGGNPVTAKPRSECPDEDASAEPHCSRHGSGS